MSDFSEDNGGAAGPRRFSVLRSWKTAPYLIGSGTAMMGDNIEHVITYWVLWQKFESPALVGFQLISHWLPFLLLSVYAGSLAERFDCRRLIQIGQIMFMVVSLCWGILFLTDSLQLWQACVLLVIHGLAGCLWGPAEQMMLHDFVDRKELPSAVPSTRRRSAGSTTTPDEGRRSPSPRRSPPRRRVTRSARSTSSKRSPRPRWSPPPPTVRR